MYMALYSFLKHFFYSLIQKYLWRACFVPGTVLGIGDQTRSPGVYSLAEGDDKEQKNK